MIQHPRVQPEQVGKAPAFGHKSQPEETATLFAVPQAGSPAGS